METNWRRIIIYLLIFLTIAAIVVAIVLSLNLDSGPDGDTTPTPVPSITLTPPVTGTGSTGDPDTCVGKGSVATSIRCRKDDSSVCPNTNGDSAVQDIMVGQEVCADGDVGRCDFYTACAPTVQEGTSCSMNYPGINEPIQSLSDETFEEGAFIGCDINNQINNCYCMLDSSNSMMSGATVTCFEDERIDGSYQFCGARTFSGGSATPTPTVTTTPTDDVEPTTTTEPEDDVCPTAPECNGDLIVTEPENPDAKGSCATYECIEISTTTTTTPVPTVPVTAITSSDEMDRIVFGLILIVSSLLLFYFDLHSKLGQSLAKMIGLNIFGDYQEKIGAEKKDFESRISDKN